MHDPNTSRSSFNVFLIAIGKLTSMNQFYMPNIKVAAIDLGSNSFHLTIAERQQHQLQVISRIKEKVKLAAGLDGQDQLSLDAQDTALKCLALFQQALNGISHQHVKTVATYTFRKAKNIDEFLPKAQNTLGYPINIISGEEEAQLIFTGVTQTLPADKEALVIDIGGGSTEFALGLPTQKPSQLDSLSMGCVTYAQHYFPNGELHPSYFEQAIHSAQEKLKPIVNNYSLNHHTHVVGSSGTIKSILEIIQNHYVHQSTISLNNLQDIQQQLIQFGNIENICFENLSKHRNDILPGGLSILIAIFKSFNLQEMHTSNAALREGLLCQLSDLALTQV